MPHLVTGVLHVAIGRVFTPRLSERSQVRLNFTPPHPQHRSNDHRLGGTAALGCAVFLPPTSCRLPPDTRPNPAQPLRPCSSHHFHQHGFRLIVERVRGRDLVE